MSNPFIKNGINNTLIDMSRIKENQNIFSKEIKVDKVSDQKSSGRCWIFAGLNTLREKVIKKYNLSSDFEFSQNYVMFWDKYERARVFLKNIDNKEKIDSRLNMFLLKDPLSDGGQWDMFASVVDKYGLVPKYIMPETYSSSNTNELNCVINRILRNAARGIIDKNNDISITEDIRTKGIEFVKIMTLQCIFDLLTKTLGNANINDFEFEYYTKKYKYNKKKFKSPQDFYKNFVKTNVKNYISIINCPTEEYNKTYTIDGLGSILGSGVKYLNVDINILKELTKKQINNNEMVWFGSDVGQDRKIEEGLGILDTKLYDYVSAGLAIFQDKKERLLSMESIPNHAMAFCGLNKNGNKVDRWKVENSWGTKYGFDGFLVMNDNWFDEYVYQVVINKKYVPKNLLKLYSEEPIVLPPWHPMGTLA
jgi:bleomycin hydrolase